MGKHHDDQNLDTENGGKTKADLVDGEPKKKKKVKGD